MWAPLIAVLFCLTQAESQRQDQVEALQDSQPATPDFSQCVNAPHVCPNKNITFWLYTRSTQDSPYELTLDNIKDAPYDRSASSFLILIHGYTGYRDYSPNMELRPAFFANGHYNLISLDYGPLAKDPCYVQAAYNVKTIANCTTRFLLEMMNQVPQVITMDNLHVIGFSLGSQVAGNIGYYFKKLNNQTVRWMTAMDPALPLFDYYLVKPDDRISEDDAIFLDVYHSDAGNKGIIRPAGKVDFYYNSGFSQPGCGTNNSCDHVRAVEYYAESINASSKGFWGTSCRLVSAINYFFTSTICLAQAGENTSVLAGFYVPHTANGTYQVITNSTSPYALGKNPKGATRSKRHALLFGRKLNTLEELKDK